MGGCCYLCLKYLVMIFNLVYMVSISTPSVWFGIWNYVTFVAGSFFSSRGTWISPDPSWVLGGVVGFRLDKSKRLILQYEKSRHFLKLLFSHVMASCLMLFVRLNHSIAGEILFLIVEKGWMSCTVSNSFYIILYTCRSLFVRIEDPLVIFSINPAPKKKCSVPFRSCF